MRDPKPLLIVLLSISLIGTWIYHLYDKTQYSLQRHEVYIKDSAAIADAVKDSLKRYLTGNPPLPGNRFNPPDSGPPTADESLAEIDRLTHRINAILKKHAASRGDLLEALRMIRQLQVRIDEWNCLGNSIEEERNRLSRQMKELNLQVETFAAKYRAAGR